MLFQIWENNDGRVGEITFVPKDSKEAKRLSMVYIAYHLGFIEGQVKGDNIMGVKLVAEFDAKTYLEACQRYYDIMGWGEYHPMLDEDGNIFPNMLEELE